MREELLKEYAEEALKNGPHRFIRPDDKVFYLDGFKDGYNLGLKAKINKTTISDAPALPGEVIADLEDKLANADYQLEGRDNEIKELNEKIEKMKAELHHRLVSPSHDDSDCLDKIVGLDRLWQFGQEF